MMINKSRKLINIYICKPKHKQIIGFRGVEQQKGMKEWKYQMAILANDVKKFKTAKKK